MRAGRAMRACLMAACLAQSCALAAAYVSHGARIGLMRTRTGPLMSADSEEEIAALQARISELKRAQEEQAEASEAAAADSESSDDDSGQNLAADFEEARIRMAKLEEREFDLKTLSFRRKVNNAQEGQVLSGLLSEGWKDDESAGDGDDGAAVLKLGAGSVLIGALLVLALSQFSFAPQSYETFGDLNAQPTETPAQIRARYEKMGYDADNMGAEE